MWPERHAHPSSLLSSCSRPHTHARCLPSRTLLTQSSNSARIHVPHVYPNRLMHRESLKAQLAQVEATLAWERSEHATVQRQLGDALLAIELTHSEVLAMGARRADLQAEGTKVRGWACTCRAYH